MFSGEFIMSSPNSADLSITPTPRLAIQFLDGSQVTWQETEAALRSDSIYDIIPGISLGATPQGRYIFNNGAVTQPFDAISVSNLDNPNSIGGTVFIKDTNGNIVATTTLPSIPPGGAAGYLLMGRTPGDPLGLFPSTTTLPARADGLFHGTLELGTTGQTATGLCIVLAQEYNGNSMLNLPVFHSPVP
jgi:hypothetical protein